LLAPPLHTADTEHKERKQPTRGRKTVLYIMKRKKAPIYMCDGAEQAQLAQSFRLEWLRRMMSSLDSSAWLKTLEFLHFQIFHRKQVIIVERVFWSGIGGLGRTEAHKCSMEAS